MNDRKYSGELLHLTNAVCEATQDYSEEFKKEGLPYTTTNGKFYPLTPWEDNFVSDNVLPIGPHWALIGCSVLLNGKKYLAPTIEFGYYDNGNRDLDWSKREAESAYRACEPLLQVLAELTGGYYTLPDEPEIEYGVGDGSFVARLLIPVEYALRKGGDLAGWCDHLEHLSRDHATKLGLLQSQKVA